MREVVRDVKCIVSSAVLQLSSFANKKHTIKISLRFNGFLICHEGDVNIPITLSYVVGILDGSIVGFAPTSVLIPSNSLM